MRAAKVFAAIRKATLIVALASTVWYAAHFQVSGQDKTGFPDGYDAVQAAPNSHKVVFENEFVRCSKSPSRHQVRPNRCTIIVGPVSLLIGIPVAAHLIFAIAGGTERFATFPEKKDRAIPGPGAFTG